MGHLATSRRTLPTYPHNPPRRSIAALYEQFCWSPERREHEWRTRQLLKDEDDNDGQPKTRVGARLSDITTKRVIVGVLTILFFTPIFDLSFYPQGDSVTVAVRTRFASPAAASSATDHATIAAGFD